MQRFIGYEDMADVVEKGTTRSTIRLRNGLQVDLRVVPEASYGAALCYFTGSKAHNIALRQLAINQGLKLNEYGLFKGARPVAGLYGARIVSAPRPSHASTRIARRPGGDRCCAKR